MDLAKRGRSGQCCSSVRVRECSRHKFGILKSSMLLMDEDRWHSLMEANKKGDELTVERLKLPVWPECRDSIGLEKGSEGKQALNPLSYLLPRQHLSATGNKWPPLLRKQGIGLIDL